jgi:kumamolisin
MAATSSSLPPGRLLPATRSSGDAPPAFDPAEIVAYYGFPTRYDGTGTTIAMVSLYGGFRQSDLDTYFAYGGRPVPAIEVVGVDGASNDPDAAPEANGELVLSMEMLGSMAPGARLVVYVAANTMQGMLDGLSTAIFARSPATDVLCLTWAIDEAGMQGMTAEMLSDLMDDARVLGLPVCAPAGLWDGGSFRPTVLASHPFVLACGATRAARAGTGLAERPMTDAAIPAAGSALWPMAQYQAGALGRQGRDADGRLVPDVCALADPRIGYRCYLEGRWTSVTGVGAAACAWAALLARLRQALGRPWGMVSDLYAVLGPGGALAQLPGAGPGWDSRTGWGAPDGERLLAQLASADR